jgi:hypothetical protein
MLSAPLDSLGVSGLSPQLWILSASLDSLGVSAPMHSLGASALSQRLWILAAALDSLGGFRFAGRLRIFLEALDSRHLHSLAAEPGYACWILSAPLDFLGASGFSRHL